jgi:uroporphyrinogen-III synthase
VFPSTSGHSRKTPARSAVQSIADGTVDVALFTTSVQVVHLFKVAAELNLEEKVRRAFSKILVGSIGPVTSEELREHGIPADFEPSHPKMGFLVNELAQRSKALLERKRAAAAHQSAG